MLRLGSGMRATLKRRIFCVSKIQAASPRSVVSNVVFIDACSLRFDAASGFVMPYLSGIALLLNALISAARGSRELSDGGSRVNKTC